MKRTDIERKEREVRRSVKKEFGLEKRMSGRDPQSVGAYIKRLTELYRHDNEKIYNILSDEDILETVLEIQEHIPEKKWDDIFRKSVRATKVQEKELAFNELRSIIDG